MSNHPELPVAAVILAAGRGSRMGGPKWQLKMPSGEPIVQHLNRQFCQFGCETVLVVNADDYEFLSKDKYFSNIPLAINNRYDLGRLYSLQCGLRQISSLKPCFVHNIDNPYVNQGLLSHIYKGLTGFDFALAHFEGRGGHPLLIGEVLVQRILNIANSTTNFRDVIQGFSGNRIPFGTPEILLNINTPEDYSQFFDSFGK